MKKFIWLACLVVLSASFISSCGGLRISSINARDDSALETEVEYNTLSQQSYGVDVDSKKLDYEIKKQSYDLESGGYVQEEATGWKEGIIKNRYDQRQVRFDVLRGGELVSSYVLEGRQAAVIDKLPLGRYTVRYYEYTVKGEYLENTWALNVTNKANRSYQGQKYFFFISN
jgi:hypothetical protein